MASKATFEGLSLRLGADITPLGKALGDINKEASATQRELKEVQKALKMDPNNVELLTQKQRLLNENVAETSNKLKVLKQAEKEVQEQFDNGKIKQEQYEAFRRELIMTEEQLKKAEKAAREFSPTLEALGNKFESAGKSIESAGKKIAPLSAAAAASGIAVTKAASDLETAFSGVRKTVDATEEQFAELEKGIRSMSKEMPQTAVEIAKVAENAGQLGIQTEAVLGFTNVMIKLGATTNMSADEASTSLARFANITSMSQNKFDRLGSTIYKVGQSLATSEKEVVNMSMGIAAAGKQIGLTEAQIVGFAGALSSVGIEAQAGGTSFSKVMIEMQLAVETNSKKLKDFAKVAGMSTKEFSKAFKEDAAGAIMSFISGLGNAEKQGVSTIKMLDDMGIKEARLRDALLRASGANDVFTASLQTANVEWETNSALNEGAAKKNENLAAQMVMLKNTIVDLAVSFGEIMLPVIKDVVKSVKDFVEKINSLDEGTKKIIVGIGLAVAVAAPLLITIGKMSTGIGALIKLIPVLTGAFSFLSIAKLKDIAETTILHALYLKDAAVKGASAAATGIMTAATAVWNVVASIAATVTTALGAAIAFLTSPIGLVIIAITALVAGIVYLWNTNENFRKFVINAWETIKKTVADVVSGMVKFFTETIPQAIQNVIDWFQNLPYNIGLALGYAYQSIIDFGTDIYNWATTEIPKFIVAIITFVSKLPGQFAEWLGNVIDTIAEWGSNAVETGAETMESLIASFIEYLSSLPGLWKEWFDKVVKYLTDLKDAMLKKGSEIMESLWSGIKNIWENVSNWFVGMVTDIINFFSSLPNTLYNIGANAMTALWDGLKSTWEGVKNWFGGVMDSIKSFGKGIEDGREAAKKKIDGSHAGGLAYVPFDGYIAQLHQGERVLTANENSKYGKDEQISKNVNVTQNIYATTQNPREQQRAAARELRRLAMEV